MRKVRTIRAVPAVDIHYVMPRAVPEGQMRVAIVHPWTTFSDTAGDSSIAVSACRHIYLTFRAAGGKGNLSETQNDHEAKQGTGR